MVEVNCILDAKAELGESTLWDPKTQMVWWIDIYQKMIHRFDPLTGSDDFWKTPLTTLQIRLVCKKLYYFFGTFRNSIKIAVPTETPFFIKKE